MKLIDKVQFVQVDEGVGIGAPEEYLPMTQLMEDLTYPKTWTEIIEHLRAGQDFGTGGDGYWISIKGDKVRFENQVDESDMVEVGRTEFLPVAEAYLRELTAVGRKK
ncbi:hypothetical protein [Amycolatopsis sp. NPDC051128]|uniref:hypothetical protein n=1 Tax=Amycolatopsis sp. NPDC051128 TaxID=3155412 RepID=UPI00343704EE